MKKIMSSFVSDIILENTSKLLRFNQRFTFKGISILSHMIILIIYIHLLHKCASTCVRMIASKLQQHKPSKLNMKKYIRI